MEDAFCHIKKKFDDLHSDVLCNELIVASQYHCHALKITPKLLDGFKQEMEWTLSELFDSDWSIKLALAEDGSGKGAAMIAAIAAE